MFGRPESKIFVRKKNFYVVAAPICLALAKFSSILEIGM